MPETVSAELFFKIGFYSLVLIFLVHAVIFSYHWISFGADRSSSLWGIGVYVGGGLLFVISLLTTFLML